MSTNITSTPEIHTIKHFSVSKNIFKRNFLMKDLRSIKKVFPSCLKVNLSKHSCRRLRVSSVYLENGNSGYSKGAFSPPPPLFSNQMRKKKLKFVFATRKTQKYWSSFVFMQVLCFRTKTVYCLPL